MGDIKYLLKIRVRAGAYKFVREPGNIVVMLCIYHFLID